MPTGRAVSASAKLWMVSPSTATEPVNSTIIHWISAVANSTPNDQTRVRMPRRLVSSAVSSRSALSWLCGVTACRTCDHSEATPRTFPR
jgi:hypothetical protein